MLRRPPRSTRTDTLCPYTTLFRSLVAKIAMGCRGYGLPVAELISEGNIGLMQGVKKFEPDKGFRLATYAMWWIRASIQEFILRSRSEEHTSELQSLMRISYAVFCLKKKNQTQHTHNNNNPQN